MVNARQILIQEARKHGRAYWSHRKSGGEHPWPLVYRERRFACLRALLLLKAAALSGLPQKPAGADKLGRVMEVIVRWERDGLTATQALHEIAVITDMWEAGPEDERAQEPAAGEGGA
jgi:hypothetical protein